jgi:hypothetical protein
MSKGYGNLNPKFAKYFKKRSAPAVDAAERKGGPHDEGKHKKPEKDVFDHINEYTEAELEELKQRFDVGEQVVVVVDDGRLHETGRIVLRIPGKDDEGPTYGVVFDTDPSRRAEYYRGNHLRRTQS